MWNRSAWRDADEHQRAEAWRQHSRRVAVPIRRSSRRRSSAARLGSLAAQSFEDWELAIDDGSRDRSFDAVAPAIVATQSLSRKLDIGVFSDDLTTLGDRLRDEPRMPALRANVWRHRDRFTFDHHVHRLVAFFREVIAVARQ